MKITHTPPIIRETENGWLLVITDTDGVQHAAPVGAWFASQFITRVVLPSLVLDAMNEPHPTLPGVIADA